MFLLLSQQGPQIVDRTPSKKNIQGFRTKIRLGKLVGQLDQDPARTAIWIPKNCDHYVSTLELEERSWPICSNEASL